MPPNLLKDRRAMSALGVLSLPMVRAVDTFVGGANAIRVDLFDKGNQRVRTSILSHEDLQTCVGDAIALFTLEVIEGKGIETISFPRRRTDSSVTRTAFTDQKITFLTSLL